MTTEIAENLPKDTVVEVFYIDAVWFKKFSKALISYELVAGKLQIHSLSPPCFNDIYA